MKSVTKEPQAIYKSAGWINKFNGYETVDFTCRIENENVIFRNPGSSTYCIYLSKPGRKLSALKGKLTKQSKKEIDEQLSKLRSEWDRNF